MSVETIRPDAARVDKEYPVRFHFTTTFGRLVIALVSVLFSSALAMEPKAGEDTEALLQSIRSRMAAHLSQLPNYTCHEMVDRLVRRANSTSFEHRDQVELEVAFVGDREYFAKPGESQFEDRPISKIVGAGTISNGAFGSSAAAIFTREGATFRYAGLSKKDGRQTVRFDFQVPEDKSRFLVSHDSRVGATAFKGSFWAEVGTLDLVRLEIKAERIPAYLGVRMVEESIKYKTVRIRETDFLLPYSSELAASDQMGNYSLNMIRFERCREFTGQSSITYDMSADGAPAERQSPEH